MTAGEIRNIEDGYKRRLVIKEEAVSSLVTEKEKLKLDVRKYHDR